MRNNTKVNVNQETRFFLRRKRNNILFMILAFSIVFSAFWFIQDVYSVNSESIANNYQNDEILKVNGKWELNILWIDDHGTGNYTWAQAVLEDWCSGNGLSNDPYIIENVTITSTNYLFEIRNSEAYFMIKDCTIWTDIYMLNVKNGIFYDNNIDDDIRIHNGNNNFIINNTIVGCVEFEYDETVPCHSNYIIGNTITERGTSHFGGGISIFGYNNLIYNNTINSHEHGIYISGNNNTIRDNKIHDNDDIGICLDTGNNTIVKENIIENNGEYGIKSVGKYWSDKGNTYNLTIYNNTISNHDYSIYFEATDYSNITNNKIGKTEKGIYLDRYSDYNTVTQNTISYIDYCIDDRGEGNIIFSNTCIYIGSYNNNPPIEVIIILIIGLAIIIISVISAAIVNKKEKNKVM